MAALDELRQQVAETRTVTDSAIALLRGLKQRLDEALGGGQLETDILALRDELNTAEQDLAQAVAANTPSEP